MAASYVVQRNSRLLPHGDVFELSQEIIAYIGDKGRCYGWHISDLRIYDAPRELSEFTGLRNTRFGAAPYDIKRAPQSWCYVEAM